jgi:hypothetical protein
MLHAAARPQAPGCAGVAGPNTLRRNMAQTNPAPATLRGIAAEPLRPKPAQAAIYNIEEFFGWVSTVADVCGAVSQMAE